MNFKRFLCVFILIYGFGIGVQVTTPITEVAAFSNQVIQHGAVGEDVTELQTRLKYLGFFTGKVDGVFGWRTYWALRNFQYEFGMEIDGIAGTATKQKLSKASKYDKPATKQNTNRS